MAPVFLGALEVTADCQKSLRILHKNQYPSEVEAAWYALKEFFHPLDCSEKGINFTRDHDGNIIKEVPGIFPMNKNYILASILAGEDTYRPTYMVKAKLYQHLLQTIIGSSPIRGVS